MKVKVIPIEEIQSKKGNLIYRCIYKDNDKQSTVMLLSKSKKDLNKETEVNVRFGNFWFEN